MKPLPPPEMPEEEMAWRHGWAFAYSTATYLYGDDGELQDNRWPMIDWMRDSALEIRDKIHKRGMMKLAENKEQVEAIFARLDEGKERSQVRHHNADVTSNVPPPPPPPSRIKKEYKS